MFGQLYEPQPPLEVSAARDVVIAWRTFRVFHAGHVAVLGSVYVDKVWPAGRPLVASSLTQHGEAADGIHAFKCRADVDAYLSQRRHSRRLYGYFGLALDRDEPFDGYAIGTVALWGRVIEHERGYRAQFAYPQQLYVADAEITRALARTYGCEVEVDPSLAPAVEGGEAAS